MATPGFPTLTDGEGDNQVDPVSSDQVDFGPSNVQWGLFLNGQPAIVSNSTLNFEFKKTAAIADYPIEGGGFESYDKVATPYDARLGVASGGSLQERTDLLKSVDDAWTGLDLYDILTPEVTYQNANVAHYDYRRTATQGLGLLQVNIWVTQIRLNSTDTANNTKSPSAAAAINSGPVQAVAATPSQAALVSSVD